MNTLTTDKKAAHYTSKKDLIKFGKALLISCLITPLILLALGDYGHKPEEFDPYIVAVKQGHFEPVVYDVQVLQEKKTLNGVLIDITITKPTTKEYCTMKTVQAQLGNKTYNASWNEVTYTKVAGIHEIRNIFFKGLHTLEGASGYVQHNCHPDFITVTPLFPFSYTKEDFDSIVKQRKEQEN